MFHHSTMDMVIIVLRTNFLVESRMISKTVKRGGRDKK
jgi:hypothetical protein